MSNSRVTTGFYGRTPVSTAARGPPGGASSSFDGHDDQLQQRSQTGLSKIVDMLNEQKQLINSVVKAQKEIEKTVDAIKLEVAEVKNELAVSLEDISHNNAAANKSSILPKPVTVSCFFVYDKNLITYDVVCFTNSLKINSIPANCEFI